MSTITTDSLTITPTLVSDYDSSREGRNVIHQIIGRADPDVTLRPASLRTGRLEAIFADEAASLAAAAALATTETATLSDPATSVNMTFVLGPSGVQRMPDPSRTVWVLTIDYVEVAP